MAKDDIQITKDLLAKLEPGFLPYPIFEQIARLVALPILEYIPLRLVDKKVEVLLLKRADDDKLWPGMLHTPGTVIRATDINKEGGSNWPAMDRILHDELANIRISEPHYVGSILHESKRGVEQAQLYWVEVLEDKPKVGVFYSVDQLPGNFMDSQKDFVMAASTSFKRTKNV